MFKIFQVFGRAYIFLAGRQAFTFQLFRRMNPPSFAQDLALKKLSTTPPDQKPNYNWRDILGGEELPVPEIQVLCPHGEERFDLSEVADTVGRSLSNLLLAKGEKDIFNEKNQRFVADVTREVAQNLTKKALERSPLRVSLHDLYVLIEKTLVDNNAHDVAKSLLLKRASKLNLERDTHGVTVRLIRRNHQVVPWNGAKIEIAISTASPGALLDVQTVEVNSFPQRSSRAIEL